MLSTCCWVMDGDGRRNIAQTGVPSGSRLKRDATKFSVIDGRGGRLNVAQEWKDTVLVTRTASLGVLCSSGRSVAAVTRSHRVGAS